MHLEHLILDGHRSVQSFLEFDIGRFTVLFGRNNSGKTNLLEAIALLLDPRVEGSTRHTHLDGNTHKVSGGAVAQLEPGSSFDQRVLEAIAEHFGTPWNGPVTFTTMGVILGDLRQAADPLDFVHDSSSLVPDEAGGLRLHPLLLDWRTGGIHERTEAAIAALEHPNVKQRRIGGSVWLELVQTDKGDFVYDIPATTQARVDQLGSLASDILPDFIDGTIHALISSATAWDELPKVLLEFNERDAGQDSGVIDEAGEGAARWMAAAVQIALHLMSEHSEIGTLRDLPGTAYSGHVLLVDEPEAHLHPSAVDSIVRWCHRMVTHGFTVIVASHHDAFLRSASERVTLVRVTRDPREVSSNAEALPLPTTEQLLELADHVGMTGAAALSLHRGILFVEGPLDKAVLDEFGHFELDVAGVKIVPIHGTKNLEGLVTAEFLKDLGIRLGILTDNTDVATMNERSKRKRSSEEKKVLRVLDIARESAIAPPRVFGVAEDDLLFALPPEAISLHYLNGGVFPEWKQLVADCREALGKSPSDSVDWKTYAYDKYGLPLMTPEGVRHIVHTLDLAGVVLPSIRRVIDEVVAWAHQDN